MNKTLFTLVLLRTACCYVAPAKPWRAAPRAAPTGRAAVRMGSNPLAKAFKTVPDWRKGIHGATVALTRVCAGVLMVHHGSEGGFLPANVFHRLCAVLVPGLCAIRCTSCTDKHIVSSSLRRQC